MSSVASPFGLKPAFHPSGCIRQSIGTILSGFVTDIFQYSPVGVLADGSIGPIASTAVATTGRIVGAFMGVEYTPFSSDLRAHEFDLALLQHVLPGWVERAGGSDSEAVKLFNEKVSPIVGVKINDNGTASKVK